MTDGFGIPLDRDWLFGGEYVTGSEAPGYDDGGFERITLPHTVTELSWRNWDPASWEKIWIYRRHFDLPEGFEGKRLFVDFGAALAGATLTLNGHELGTHLGGYLPFSFELTDAVRPRGNVLAVRLDARFTVDAPPNAPDKPSVSVDFWQPGGLYRGVVLRAVPEVFLADVFAKPVDVLTAGRRVDVECTLDALRASTEPVRVDVVLRDGERTISSAGADVTVSAAGSSSVELRLTGLGDVELWHPEHPRLYHVTATLSAGGEVVHEVERRIGFRDAKFTERGFFLNGERLQLFGINRHQFYPFAGGAMPDRVQRKDAELLRDELNCNLVRCAHYPHAEAFLDACDELGLMVWDEPAGWGHLGGAAWKELAVRDVGDLIRRDRNHPSVVIWGARLNETADDTELYTRTDELAHTLDDSRQTTGAMIVHYYDTTDYQHDVFSFNDYRKEDGHASLRPPRTDYPYFVSEAVGTLSGPATFYRRTDSLADLQGQAYAHAHVHDAAASDERYCGLVGWVGIDYPSGTGNVYWGIKNPGVVDMFRVPKPGAAIYRSQVDPARRPVIVPAFAWDFGPKSPPQGPGAGALVCSNCERLEVYVGGAHHASVQPDTATFCHLPYPPFVLDLTVDGSAEPDLRIDGYLGDRLVVSRSFAGSPRNDAFTVTADDARLLADGTDATRVLFRVLDEHGALRPYVEGDVTVDVAGPGVLVGESPFAFGDVGGVGAVWLRTRAGEPGAVTVTVTHERYGSSAVTIMTE